MSLWKRFGGPRAKPEEDSPEDRGPVAGAEAPQTLVGERGRATVHRASLQARMSNGLAGALMAGLGLAALGWYYTHVAGRTAQAVQAARHAAQARAGVSAPLPPLGPFQRPMLEAPPPAPSLASRLLGPPPALSGRGPADPAAARRAWARSDTLAARGPLLGGSVRAPALARALAGPVFAGSGAGNSPVSASPETRAEGTGVPRGASWTPGDGGMQDPDSAGRPADSLSALLKPTVLPAVQASELPSERLLLPKGAFIDCTLETAIDTTLAGMTTCVTATDTFSADGTVVLLGRGTELIGETRGQVRQGQARVFVLWTEARTPQGVVVPLDSPGTDALGRAGLTGTVNTHFWQRFGAAILVSVIDAGVQAGIESASNGGTVIVNPAPSEAVMTGVLRSTVDIPPTIRVPQGSRIQVLVARDVDFRSVYRLALVPEGPRDAAKDKPVALRRKGPSTVFKGSAP